MDGHISYQETGQRPDLNLSLTSATRLRTNPRVSLPKPEAKWQTKLVPSPLRLHHFCTFLPRMQVSLEPFLGRRLFKEVGFLAKTRQSNFELCFVAGGRGNLAANGIQVLEIVLVVVGCGRAHAREIP